MEFISSIYKKILKQPKLILIFLLILLSLSFYQGKKFQLDASADTLLVENDPDLNYLRSVNERYASEDFFVVTYSPKQLLNKSNIKEFKKFVDEINNFKWVSKTISVLNSPLFESSDKPLIEKIKDIEYITSKNVDFNRALKELKNSPVYKKLIINDDASVFGIVVYIKDNQEYLSALKVNKNFLEKKQKNQLTSEDKIQFEKHSIYLEKLKKQRNKEYEDYNAEIRSHISKYKSQASINLSGIPMIVEDLINYVKKDIVIFGSGVFIFMLITLWIIFRDIKWVIFPLLSCLISIALMIGTLGYLNWKVTVISSNFISIMLVLTMEINIHYIQRYKQFQDLYPKKKETELTQLTADGIFQSILYGVFITIIGFLSFIFCDIRPVIDFGYMMSVGLIISMLVTMILLPSLIIQFKPKIAKQDKSKNSKFFRNLADFAINKKLLIIFSSTTILLASFYGSSKITVENSFINYFNKDTEIYKGMKLIDEKLGGTTPLEIIVKFKDSSSKKDSGDDFFETSSSDEFKDSYWFTNFRTGTITNIHQYLESLPEIGKVLSFYSVIQMGEKINDNKKLGSLEMAILYSKLPDDIKKNIVSPYISIENNEARFSVRVVDSNPNLNRKELLNKIQKHLEENIKLSKDDFKITGVFVLFNNQLQSLYKSQIQTLSFSYFGILIALFILFRSWMLSLIASAPDMVASMLILGSLGFLKIPLDMMTITIATIVMGIGTRAGIYYINRFKSEFAIHKDYKKTIRACHETVGKSIVIAALTIIFGFSILVLSNFNPTINFGILIGIAIFAALILSLTIMPLLLLITKPFKNG
jgi:predicted RND superfamily exporter protein